MAQLPVPGRAVHGADTGLRDGSRFEIAPLAEAPRTALRTLIDAGHDAVLVGGCVRDVLVGSRGDAGDWDLATSAPPQVVTALFAGSVWENRFGTVTLPGTPRIEITSYRSESGYRDRRRPDEVSFGTSLEADLARRDFTINAIAWRPTDLEGDWATGVLVDPHHGLEDLQAGLVRAVGDPFERLAEDALRVLRAVRFSLRLGFTVDPATEAALRRAAPLTRSLSAERVRDELVRLLSDARIVPSEALRRWEELGLLGELLPELAALRGVLQGKQLGGDALDHSLRTADALPSTDPILRVAGLLHDLGKATTLADGHFIGHERVGSELAADVLSRLRFPTTDVDRAKHLVRHHMLAYRSTWTDAAVRRLMARVGIEHVDGLLALAAADDAASHTDEAGRASLRELGDRIAVQRSAPVARRQLAIDGNDLQRELGLRPGPRLGALLVRLTDEVIEDPSRNERDALLARARELHATLPGV